MVPYDRLMINHLLDTYEQSVLSIGENCRTINIEMRFTKKNMPAYFNESAAEYEQIHIWAKRLEEKELITIIWKNGKTDHIIEKIRLNIDYLPAAYGYVKRIPKLQYEENMLRMLRQYIGINTTADCSMRTEDEEKIDAEAENSPVCKNFILYLIQRIEEHKSVKEYIGLDDLEGTEKLLNTLKCIEQNDTPRYIREFSIKILKDSKAFEKVENKVAGIFKRFSDKFIDLELPEILAEYNIYHTPDYVYLKGDCLVRIGKETIALSALKQGVGISGEDIEGIQIINYFQKIEKVITIENLTTFFRYSDKNSLVLYLGGYHNTSRRRMLQKIYKEMPDVQYYHFGDIDAGGFRIFYDLRKKTGIPFSMLHMDLETIQKYKMYGKQLTKEDRKRLQELAANEEIFEIVNYMLKQNVKLEQECILV